MSSIYPGDFTLKLNPVPGVDRESNIKGEALMLEIHESKGVPTLDLH